MLPEPTGAYLRYFVHLTDQSPNQWDGFDRGDATNAPTLLRDQLAFAGLATALLAAHPAADPDERTAALQALIAFSERLAQRRIWADAATASERAGLTPDPISAGNAGFAGQLTSLFVLRALHDVAPPEDEPIELRWSHDFCFRYAPADLSAALLRGMREWPDGGLPSFGTTALPHEMMHVVWALHLSNQVFARDTTAAIQAWLEILEKRIALSGPQLFGRGVFAGQYDLRRRRASFGSDLLCDAWTLALLAPLAPELARRLVERFRPALARATTRSPLLLGFAYLLEVELGDPERAERALAAFTEAAPVQESAERRYLSGSAAPLLTAIAAIGACGGMRQIQSKK